MPSVVATIQRLPRVWTICITGPPVVKLTLRLFEKIRVETKPLIGVGNKGFSRGL